MDDVCFLALALNNCVPFLKGDVVVSEGNLQNLMGVGEEVNIYNVYNMSKVQG